MAQNLASIETTYGVSLTQIQNAINGVYGTQAMSPRYRLLDQTLTPVTTGGRSNVGDPADLSDYVVSCTTTSDVTQTVTGTAQFTLRETAPQLGTSITINPLTHMIQVVWQYWATPPSATSSGDLLLEVPWGVYGLIIPDRTVTDAGDIWSVQAADPSYQLNQLPFLNAWTVAAGTNVVTAITQILTAGAIPLSQGGTGQTPVGLDFAGPGLPASRINIAPTTLTTPATIVYTSKDTVLSAVNALLDSINYQPLWVDGSGVFQSAPKPNYAESVPSPAWTYASGPNSTIQQPVTWRVTDQTGLANIVKVISENATAGQTFSSVAINNNNTVSALCLSTLGRAMVLVIEDDTIPDQDSCDLRAHVELQAAAVLGEQIQFGAWPNPILQPHDVIAFTYTSPDGTVSINNADGWEITGLALDCQARTLQVQAGRVVRV